MKAAQLQAGWRSLALSDVCKLVNGRAFKPTDWTKVGLPIVRIQNLNDATKPFNRYDGKVDPRFLIDSEDLLFAWSGTPGTSFGAHIWRGGRAVLNQHIFRVLPASEVVDKYFLRLAINDRLAHLVSVAHGGAGLAHVTKPVLEATQLSIPPLHEQRHIVTRIEALTQRSRRAKEALDAIPPLLERFRQSVLAAAFRGDLTKDWRANHPGVELKWLEVARASLSGGDLGARRANKHLWGSGATAEGVSSEWPATPGAWRWVKVKDIGQPDDVVQIGPMSMKSKEFIDDGHRVLNVGCVQWGTLDLAKSQFLPRSRAKNFSRYATSTGDVLITRSGTVGRAAVVTQNADGAVITFHVIRVRTAPTICLPEYLQLALWGCPSVQEQLKASAIGATRAGLNTRLIQDLWLPLAPPDEQVALVSRAGELLAAVAAQREAVTAAATQLRNLDASILAKAFRGELTNGVSGDE